MPIKNIASLRRDAAMVSELFDAALAMTSDLRKERYNQAREWFEKKHWCNWQDWHEKPKEKTR